MSGNYNCGGHNRIHGRYEATPRIDSFELVPVIRPLKEGKLSYMFPLEWSRSSEKCASVTISYQGDTDSLFVIYDLNKQPRKELLSRSYVPNPYGGEKMYFICPGCGKRVRIVCATKKGFVCRVCGGLNYRVQQSGRDDVLIHRMEKLLRALEVDVQFMNVWDMTTFYDVERPRYMREKRFDKLRLELMLTQNEYWRRQRVKLAGMGIRT